MSNENKTMTGKGWKILLFSLLLVALVVTVIVIIATSNNSTTTVTSSSSSMKGSSSITAPTSSDTPTSSSGGGNTSSGGGTSIPDVPTIKEIVFMIPVENGKIIKEYTDTTIVWSQTLGMYTGHMAMDIAGEENAKVFAAFDGEITSITTSYLEGVTVVVNHGNGLESIYNSLEVDENLEVGDKVSKGDTLGVISTNNRQEYKDGAHLHFSVKEDGVLVSPNKYLMGLEK